MAETPDGIDIEIVWPRPQGVDLTRLRLPVGSTAADALTDASSARGWPHHSLEGCALGIFSRRIELSHVLRDGDRLEIYRPLQLDPKEARRRRAKDRR